MVKAKLKPLILVVEDETSINEVYQLVLTRAGYEVQAAFDGQKALDMLESFEPDIIMLDLRMPKVDGLEFLRKYDLKQHPKVKVVILSNYDAEKDIKEAHKLGASRYVLKAWSSPKELELLIKKVLQEE
jgi:CheY-like chemotaxis protein